MRWLALSLVAAAVTAAFLLGWLNPGGEPEPVGARRADRAASGINDAGPTASAIEDLAAYIANDHPAPPPGGYEGDPPPPQQTSGDPPPIPPPALLPPPPPPPPPDVGLVFRRQVTGVISEPGGRLAVLMADAGSGRGARRLRVGDRFDDTWTLIGLTREAALLSDGDRRRRVPFFGGPVTSEGPNRG